MSQRPRKSLGGQALIFGPLDEEAAQKFWAFIKPIIQDILQNRSVCQVSFEDLYGHVFSLVQEKGGSRVHSMIMDLVTEHLVQVGADVLASVEGRNFLSTLSQAWNHHHRCTLILNSIMAHLFNCHHVRQYNTVTIYEMSVFRDRVIPEGRVRNCLHATLLGMSSFQVVRQGKRKFNNLNVQMRHAGCEVVDRYDVKSICHMLKVLEIDTSFVYKDDLETPYINILREIYPSESQKLLEEIGISEYIKVVEDLMSKEDEQAKKCSENSSKDAVVAVMEEELIAKLVKTFFETETLGVMHMIKINHSEDLACMYKLLVRVQDGPKMMIELVSKCLREEGKSIIASHDSLENAISFVQEIFELKNRFYAAVRHMLHQSFQNNIFSYFKRAMDNDLKYILHLNSDSFKYITAFIDEKLEKGLEKVKVVLLTSIHNHFLPMLNQTWCEYYKNLVTIRDVRRCMGDDHVQQNHPDNVFNFWLAAFRDQVLSEVRDYLRATLLDMLMRDRRGEVVDRLAIRSTCDMFVILKTDSFNMYRDVFEFFFVKQSAEFYKLESEKCLRESGVAMYLKVVAGFIKREGERANSYIDSSLVKTLVGLMEEEFVSNHLTSIIEAQADLLPSVDTHFLQTLTQIWEFYLSNVVDIRNILMQNDRDFDWQSTPDRIFKMGLKIFENLVFANGHVRDLQGGTLLDMLTRDGRGEAVDRSAIKSSCEMMKATLLDMLMRDRRGEAVDRLAIKSACDMFIILKTDSFNMYREVFEFFFVKQSSEFYKLESEKCLRESGVAMYLKVVAGFIKREGERANSYIDSSLVKTLVGLMEEEFVSNHLTSIIEAQADLLPSVDTNFLQTLTQIWEFYLSNVVDIRNILMQNDRDFEWQSKPDTIFKMGLEIFENLVFANGCVRERLSDTLLDMLTRDRRGEAVDRSAIKSSCEMMKALGREDNDFYKDYFETPYLEESAEFYQCNGQKLFEENDVNKYIKRVTTLINEEVERAHYYLSNSVVHMMEKELISKHMKSMLEMKNSGVVHMLKNKQFEDLYNMYNLLGRVPQGQKTMYEFFGNYLTEECKALLPEEDTRPNAVSFIQGLLDLWILYSYFFKQPFENNKIFKNQIEQSFQNILNHSSKTPEYFSVFFNYKVSRVVKEKTEHDIENELYAAVILFRLLREKDVFEQCYRRKLAKRLLLNKSISDDLEKYVVSKLKIECGHLFSSRLEGMLQDMTISKTTMEDFKKGKETGAVKCDMDLSVCVLTTGIWPLQIFSYQSTVPVAAMDAFQAFRKFYLNKYSGRRLLLQTQLGSADLEATFYENFDEVPACPSATTCFPWSFKSFKPKLKRIPKRKHIICVSTNQMCILMLFNSSERLTYKEIMNETNIPNGKLVRELQSLTLSQTSQRLLIKEPNVEHIDSSDIFYVNDNFTSKLHRVKIQPAAKTDTVPERKEIRIKVDKERVYEIEATIVRIMKSKRRFHHNDLIIEVTKQLQSRFLPHPDAIKSRIERLIERDYLAREPDDSNLYKYLV